MSDAGPWDAGTHMRRTRIVHPFLAKFGWSYKGGLSTGWQWQGGKLAGSVYMFDKSTRVHYGYTWNAERIATGQYCFTVLPLDPSVVKPVAPLARPTFQVVVGLGSTFEVDFMPRGASAYTIGTSLPDRRCLRRNSTARTSLRLTIRGFTSMERSRWIRAECRKPRATGCS
jgi:hypothetical protein